MWLLALALAACPDTTEQCGACPEDLAARFEGTGIVGGFDFRCTMAGLATLAQAGCADCVPEIRYDFPFEYADCATEESDACAAWEWLKCAFPNDDGMHAYFFVDGAFLGTGFQVEKLGVKRVKAALAGADIKISDDPCKDAYPDSHLVVQAELQQAEEHGVALFGWDGCPCTGIAQSRFGSMDACYTQLTWSNPQSDVMSYLQCVEGDKSHHSFIYTRAGGEWVFQGNGFQLDKKALPDAALRKMLEDADYEQGCQNVFSVNVYGEPLAECRASVADNSGSWMWDGKCTEEGGGVHQICMDQLPGDFSVTTGQSAWSETRQDQRHCVCVGAWSLYMTREEDPEWTTTEAWPFCSAIPASALTSRYIAKWKDWNGIPASIVLGVTRLVQKCFEFQQGPGSEPPSELSKCTLLEAFRGLKALEPSLDGVAEAEVSNGAAAALNCEQLETEVQKREERVKQAAQAVAPPGDDGATSHAGLVAAAALWEL